MVNQNAVISKSEVRSRGQIKKERYIEVSSKNR